MPSAFLSCPSVLPTLRPRARSATTSARMSVSCGRTVRVGDVPSILGPLVETLCEKRESSIAISGGSLPKILSQSLISTDLDLSLWKHVFLADERIVSSDHPHSNFREIISCIPALASSLLPINHTLPPHACASHYQHALQHLLGPAPQFDLILLGLGPDGHTCSLFPDHPLLQVTDRLVASITDSPKPPSNRVTLTLPVLNAAKSVIFVCTGLSKAPVLKDILENPESTLPAALVRPVSGSVTWLLDHPAASQLSPDTLSPP